LNGHNLAGVVFGNTNNLAKKISLLIIHLLSNQVPPIKLAIGISACVDVAETFSSDREEGILGVLVACLNPADPQPAIQHPPLSPP
jgi:hypothetical protein